MNMDKKSKEVTIAAGQLNKEREYWLNRLSGNPEKTFFPYDLQETSGDSKKSEPLKFPLPPELDEKLMRLSSGSLSRLFMALTAGLITVLYKYTGNTDIILGTSIDKQEIQGEFINRVLALRNRFSCSITFKELLFQVRETVIGAVENRNYPIEVLLYDLKLPASENEFPLFDIAVLLENIHCREYLQPIKINMVFSFLKTGNSLEGALEFNPGLYREETAAGIAAHFISTLGQALANPALPISRLDILLPEEKQQLLYEFNRPGAEYPENKLLHQFFEEEARKRPRATALVLADRQLSYKQLNDDADRLARQLRKQGTARDTIVGLMVDISIEMVVAMAGILKAGGAFMPIDPHYPLDRILYMIDDSHTPLVLTQTKYKSKTEYKFLFRDYGKMIDLQEPLPVENKKPNPVKPDQPGHLVYVIYTSGSTGNPKGVMIQHPNIVNQMFGLKKQYTFASSFHHILLAPFTFDPSVQQIFLPLSTSGKLYLVPESTRKDVEKLVTVLLKNQIDILNTVPSLMILLLETVNHRDNQKLHFKYIILAGEIFSRDLYLKLMDRKTIIPEKIINIYGPTEAAINTTAYECRPDENNLSIPIGKPLLNYNVHILDGDLGMRPRGVPGELCISGAGISRGYLNNPELTAEKFIVSDWSDWSDKHYKLYKTGDLARWLPDGNLEFLGRLDHQVKIRGTRIELGEIERQLIEHEDVKNAVVTVKEDQDGDKYLCAYLVMAD
jgi:tyrocidine synthetase-3